uniref:Uncharacterized protein n=1 Tax=Pseudo-nitzschia australis TaxID=44445 RepID=A0A7S4EJU6_9STRA
MHGCGQRKFANGDTYIGQYHKGQRSGGPKCKLRFANGDLYVGGWENDRFHGDGRYFFAHDGSVLEGSFVHGAKEGKFKLQRQLPNEKLDILRFESDKLIGLGVRWNAKRSKTWLLQVVPVPNQGPAVRKHNNSNINSNNKERQETATTISCKDDNNEHDSNNSSTTSAEKKTKKKKFHHRVVGYLVKPLRRDFRCRTKLSVEPVALMPSSSSSSSSVVIPVDSSSKINGDNDDSATTNARSSSSFSASMSPSPSISPFFSLPVDNIVPVVPEKILTNIKKSVRIPISQAVSIGYDCEMGTTTITAKTTRISTKVMSTASPSVSPTGQRFQTVVS